MGLSISTKSFECTIADGLVRIVLDQPERGNPIDGQFCREFGLRALPS
jgi:2-(1,2-epoxy-1,2-dihydrophenyl)acetyl-CoA isomerase